VSEVWKYFFAFLGSGACATLVSWLLKRLDDRKSKKNGMAARLERVETKVDKLTDHSNLQYLSLLRLTVMDSDMPMSERLIAGKEYLAHGGNGDVKEYYKALENRVNG
jgi:hypothetical protein